MLAQSALRPARTIFPVRGGWGHPATTHSLLASRLATHDLAEAAPFMIAVDPGRPATPDPPRS